jgi:hypothetical protein
MPEIRLEVVGNPFLIIGKEWRTYVRCNRNLLPEGLRVAKAFSTEVGAVLNFVETDGHVRRATHFIRIKPDTPLDKITAIPGVLANRLTVEFSSLSPDRLTAMMVLASGTASAPPPSAPAEIRDKRPRRRLPAGAPHR